MDLKVRKIGNSLGVLLPAEVVEALQVTAGDALTLTPAGNGYHLRSSDADFTRKLAVLQETVRSYKNALRELAR